MTDIHHPPDTALGDTPAKDEHAARILVVDDEERVRIACRDVLVREGYTVETAGSGAEGLRKIASDHFDIVLLDLMMPAISGLDVLPKIKALHADTVVIVISGYATLEHSIEAMKKGAFDFVPKPFTPRQLREVVGKAIAYTRALQDIATEQSRMRVLINRLSDGVLATDRHKRVILANPAFRQMMCSGSGSLVGRMLDEAVTNEELRRLVDCALAMDKDEFVELTRELSISELPGLPLVGEGKEAPDAASDIVTLPGPIDYTGGEEGRILAARCFPFRDRLGLTLGAITVLHDITAMKRADQLKSDFVSLVAHEIRAPMGAVFMQLDALQDGLAGDLTDKQREILQRASQRIQSLVDLASDLLNLSKIESGLIAQERERLPLAEAIREQIELHQPLAGPRRISLSAEIPPGLPDVIFNREGLREVLSNLLVNAIKYTPEGGSVTVTAEELNASHANGIGGTGGTEVCVSVRDTGIGIAPEEQPLVFRRFYRVRNAETRFITGTGLGLSLVKRILDAHHGRIQLESTVGQGSVFRLCLPTAPPVSAAESGSDEGFLSEPFQILPHGGVVLTLEGVCIQTAAKRAHKRLAAALLEPADSPRDLEKPFELLGRFLSGTDFAVLRARHPELAGGSTLKVRIFLQADGIVAWERHA